MISALIDWHALLKVLYGSVLAGVSIAVVFSLAILGATRASDCRREGREGASVAYGVLATVAALISAGIVVYGLILVTRK
jgi:hypothetical protein